MLISYPDYYSEFKCIASDCRHSCCIGWEIDIDSKSYARYMAAEGELGDKLRRSIEGEDPHFILDKDERCPFLNGEGLCELILSGGEDMLCQICADHPRFRNVLPGITEIGLGLSCEAASRLILGRREPFKLITEGESDKTDERCENILAFRDYLFAIVQSREKPIDERMEELLERSGASLPPDSEWKKLFTGLERLDEKWTELLDYIDRAPAAEYLSEHEREIENLLCYFLYRHVPEAFYDGDIPTKAAFSVLAVRVILRIAAGAGEELCEISRMFSSEIEYSDENVDAILDALYEFTVN